MKREGASEGVVLIFEVFFAFFFAAIREKNDDH
jgi:hypothetical protein